MKAKFGILGVGKMGGAILNGVLKSSLYLKKEIAIYTKSEEKRNYYKNDGFIVYDSAKELFESTQIILLGIKPQMFDSVLNGLNELDYSNQAIISIAPGKRVAYLEKLFPNALIARAMPNTPALINQATSTLCFNKQNELSDHIEKIFASFGSYVIVQENQIDEAIPLNGSMPAYLFAFANAFIQEAIKRGFGYEEAKKLCFESIIGSASLALNSSENLETLIQNVCSKGGTTIAGLNQLEENGFSKAIEACYKSCVDRSKELAKNDEKW